MQLAASHQVKCDSHAQELAQLFCTSHSKLICFRCRATTHHTCPELIEVECVTKEKRRNFQGRLESLEVKDQQVNNIKEHFNAMRKTAHDTFDDLSRRVGRQRRDVLNLIQSEEDAMKALLEKMENVQVIESPDDGLLEIYPNLVFRLDKLESEMKPDTRDVGRLVFDDQTLTRLQTDLAQLGQIQQPTSGPAAGATATTSATASGQRRSQVGPTTAEVTLTSAWSKVRGLFRPNPRGAGIPPVLKVGDRVKLAPEVSSTGIQPGDTGTVTAIPSRRVATWDFDPQGRVDVRWDSGHERCHRMGENNKYQLILS